MALYRFVGRDVLGRRRSGILEAESEDIARTILLNRGIVTIERLKEHKPLFEGFSFRILGRVPKKDVLLFTRQLQAMVGAGIPLVEALKIIADQTPNPNFKGIIKDMASFIEEGGRFSTALSRYRWLFGELYVSTIRAAEEVGNLEESLKRLADYMEKIEKLKGKIKSALSYPLFVVGIAFAIIVGILVFIIPTFEKIYDNFGRELPFLTLLVIEISRWLKSHFVYILLPSVALSVALFEALKIKKTRYLIDSFLLKLPVLGKLILKGSIASFSRTFSSMLSGGINILDAIKIAAETAGNEIIREALLKAREQVERGVSFSTALSRMKVFPPMVITMAAIGEEAGNLDEMMAKVADFYEEEVDRTVESLSSLIEPLLIVFIGFIIGFIIIALYLPVFKMGELVSSFPKT